MPQTFQVLRCYKCEVFQVHPTKRAAKWECKLCGEKQSMKRFYGLGTGKECRLYVQKLNKIRGEIDSTHGNTNDLSNISESPDNTDNEQDKVPVCTTINKSKWLDYVDSISEEKQNTSDETMHLNNTEVVLELPIKRRKKKLSVKTKTSITQDNIENESLHEKEPTRLLHDYTKDNVSSFMESKNVDINTSITKPANKIISKKYVPPPIVDKSRWAQFVEDSQNHNDENESDPIVCAHSSVSSVFPFLEDEDIDSVLDL